MALAVFELYNGTIHIFSLHAHKLNLFPIVVKNFMAVEANLIKESIKIPVYFTLETTDFLKYYEKVNDERSSKTESALNGNLCF